MRLGFVGLLLLFPPAGPAAPLPDPVPRILFIGNSLTYANDLPGLVARVAQAAGDSVIVRQVAGPNLALIDHLAGATDAARVIQQGGWSYVVLQQGPTTVGICRDTLILGARRFARWVEAEGGRVALFMPWGARDGRSPLDASRGSWLAAARAVNGELLPVGDAWHLALQTHPELPLYGPDGYHPGLPGSLLAALTIYERLSGHDARRIPASALARLVTVSPLWIQWLQEAAHSAVSLPLPSRIAPGVTGSGPC